MTGQPTSVKEKWGTALNGGFVVIPTVLLRHQRRLGIDCESIVILANLLASWWQLDKRPYPRTETLALRTGLSRRTVQRRVQALEEAGLIKREWQPKIDQNKHSVAQYDLMPLVIRLQMLSGEDRQPGSGTDNVKNTLDSSEEEGLILG